MHIPVFEKAIKKCDSVLEPFGVKVSHVINTKNDNIFDDILNSFVGISAIQVIKMINKKFDQ